MAQATLTARVDEKDKINFDAFCSNVGLNTSTAINLFVLVQIYVYHRSGEDARGTGIIYKAILIINSAAEFTL